MKPLSAQIAQVLGNQSNALYQYARQSECEHKDQKNVCKKCGKDLKGVSRGRK